MEKYRPPLFVGLAGVIVLVVGLIVPGWGWLAWLGGIIIFAMAFIIRLWFVGDWTPTLFAENERGKDGLPPPPTMEG